MPYVPLVFRQKLVSSFSSKTIFAKNRPDKLFPKNRATYFKFLNEHIKRLMRNGLISLSSNYETPKMFSFTSKRQSELMWELNRLFYRKALS